MFVVSSSLENEVGYNGQNVFLYLPFVSLFGKIIYAVSAQDMYMYSTVIG